MRASKLDTEAARWALTLRDPDASAEDIQDALAAIDRSDESRAAFERADRLLAICENLDPQEVAASPAVPARTTLGWRSLAAVAASFCLLLIGDMASRGGHPIGGVKQETVVRHYASKVGQLRTIHLEDGSTITLAGGSGVAVAFEDKARRVDLTHGEALFDVAKNPERPFIVQTGMGSTTAIGTSFNIVRDVDGATVTVVHGVVEVDAIGRHGRAVTRLRPAMQVHYSNAGAMEPPQRVDLETVVSWRQGTLNFNGQPLGSVIAELNRYAPEPIEIEGRDIAAFPVTGIVRINNIDDWLRGLASLANCDLIHRPDGMLLRQRLEPMPSSVTI